MSNFNIYIIKYYKNLHKLYNDTYHKKINKFIYYIILSYINIKFDTLCYFDTINSRLLIDPLYLDYINLSCDCYYKNRECFHDTGLIFNINNNKTQYRNRDTNIIVPINKKYIKVLLELFKIE